MEHIRQLNICAVTFLVQKLADIEDFGYTHPSNMVV
ncbi:hypothetical protein ECOG_00158 [Escherichia coli H299]|nr:hypothetical protein ECOG_00158 [Escherichia coli H299]